MTNARLPVEPDGRRGDQGTEDATPKARRHRGDAITDAVRFLAGADRSTGHITRHLARRGHSNAGIRDAIRKLERLGYLNEETMALRLAKSWLARRFLAQSALRDALKAKEFPVDIAEEAARRAYDTTTEQAVAARFLSSLPVKFKDPGREARRRASLLAARGFPSDCLESVLNRAIADQDQTS